MSDAEVPAAVPSAHSWSPGTLWPGLRIAGGFGAVAIGVLGDDPLALVITGMLALFLIPSGVLQLLRRPLIEVVDSDLALRRISRVEFIPRSAVEEVRALDFSRWGMRHHQMRLEYVDDSGLEQLEVFTRMDLGVDPRDVVDALGRLGFPTR
ncbi:MAG TPA: PH domain-containing protein [Candidatus Dietzia intestinipullorum]|nr:PH domain-containing protein [Candidatus Dietzia intestinipullorum]